MRPGSPQRIGKGAPQLRELVRTNDIVLVSAVGALLDGANIHHLVLDQNMSISKAPSVSCRAVSWCTRTITARRGRSSAMPGSPTNCGPMTDDSVAEYTEDAFLGGQLRLRQPRSGHRAGHDAMLLAAATPARPGDRVVEFGAGVGAAGLAVARRVAGIELVLVEIDAVWPGWRAKMPPPMRSRPIPSCWMWRRPLPHSRLSASTPTAPTSS